MPARVQPQGTAGDPHLTVIAAGGGAADDRPQTPPEIAGDGVEVIDAGERGELAPASFSPGSALNIAAGRARGRILAFLGPGVRPKEGWGAGVLRFFEENPEADGILGTTVLPVTGAVSAAEAAIAARREPASGAFLVSRDAAMHVAVRWEAFVRADGFNDAQPCLVAAYRSFLRSLDSAGPGIGQCPYIRADADTAGSVFEFMRRQCEAGAAAFRSAPFEPVRARLARALSAPWRALRAAPRLCQAVPALALTAVAPFLRLLGLLGALARGGHPESARPSPLVGPRSGFLMRGLPDEPQPVASVVVPAYHRPRWLRTVLQGLLRQDFAQPYEVVVATDEESGLGEELSWTHPGVRATRCDPAGGPGGARNRGLEAARGRYVAFLDADCLPERDWLRSIVRACIGREGGPVAGWLESARPCSYVSRADNVTEQGTPRPAARQPVWGTSGCNMCVAADLVRASGAAFAEGVFGAEDVALLGKLPPEALPVEMEPMAQARHLRSDGIRGALVHQYRIGVGSGQLRRTLRMRGTFVARHIWLAPLVPVARFAMMSARAMRARPWDAADFVRLCPLIAIELIAYGVGFVRGALAARRPAAREG